jgi:hypothetical protein
MVHNLPLDDFFLTDFLCMMKCLRHRLATDLLALCPQEADDVTTLAQLKSVINVDCSLPTKQGVSQLKDSFALNVFTLENHVQLLNANQMNLALFHSNCAVESCDSGSERNQRRKDSLVGYGI